MRAHASAPTNDEAETAASLQRRGVQAQLKQLRSQRIALEHDLEYQLGEMNLSQHLLNERLRSVEQRQHAFQSMVQGSSGEERESRAMNQHVNGVRPHNTSVESAPKLADATESSNQGVLSELLENVIEAPLPRARPARSSSSPKDIQASTQATIEPKVVVQQLPSRPRKRDAATQLRSSSASASRVRSPGYGHSRASQEERPQVLAQLARDISELIQNSRSASAERRTVRGMRHTSNMPEASLLVAQRSPTGGVTPDESRQQRPLTHHRAHAQQAMSAPRLNPASATSHLESAAATAPIVNEPPAPSVPKAVPPWPQERTASEPVYQSGSNPKAGSSLVPSMETHQSLATASSIQTDRSPPAAPSTLAMPSREAAPVTAQVPSLASLGAPSPTSGRLVPSHRSDGGSPKRHVALQVEVQRPVTPSQEDVALQSKLAQIEQREEGLRAKVAQLAKEKMNQERALEDEIQRLQAANSDLQMELQSGRAATLEDEIYRLQTANSDLQMELQSGPGRAAAARGLTASQGSPWINLPRPASAASQEPLWPLEAWADSRLQKSGPAPDPLPISVVMDLKKQLEHVRQEVTQAAHAFTSTSDSVLGTELFKASHAPEFSKSQRVYEDQIQEARSQVQALQSEVLRATAFLTDVAAQKEQPGLDDLRAEVGALRADVAHAASGFLRRQPTSPDPDIANLRVQFEGLRAEVSQCALSWQPPPSITRTEVEELHARLTALRNEIIQPHPLERGDQEEGDLRIQLRTLIDELRAWRTDGTAVQTGTVAQGAVDATTAATCNAPAPECKSAEEVGPESGSQHLSVPAPPSVRTTIEKCRESQLHSPRWRDTKGLVRDFNQTSHLQDLGIQREPKIFSAPRLCETSSRPFCSSTEASLLHQSAYANDQPRKNYAYPEHYNTASIFRSASCGPETPTRGAIFNVHRASPSEALRRIPLPPGREVLASNFHSSSGQLNTGRMTPPWPDSNAPKVATVPPVPKFDVMQWSDRMLPETSRSSPLYNVRDELGNKFLAPPPARGHPGGPPEKLGEPVAASDKPWRMAHAVDMHSAHGNAATLQPPMLAT